MLLLMAVFSPWISIGLPNGWQTPFFGSRVIVGNSSWTANLGLALTAILAFIACLAGRRWPTAVLSTYGLLEVAGTLATWVRFSNANASQGPRLSAAFGMLVVGVVLGFLGSWPDLRKTVAAAASDLAGGTETQRIHLNVARGMHQPFELSYWETLRAWWPIYWPSQVIALLVFGCGQWLRVGTIYSGALSILIGTLVLWLLTPRVLGRADAGFHIVACGPAGEIPEVDGSRQTHLRFFVCSRFIAALLVAGLFIVPLNRLLGTLSASLIAALTALFAIGPVVMTMLVGSQIQDFRVEARRPATDRQRDAGISPAPES
jgi:hypothetical protein